MKISLKLSNIVKCVICAFLFTLIIVSNNVFAITNTKKVTAINGNITVTFKYKLTTTPKIKDFSVTQTINNKTSKIVKPTKITMNSTKKIITLTVPVIAKTSAIQKIVYKVSYKKDIAVSSSTVTVDKIIKPVTETIVPNNGKISEPIGNSLCPSGLGFYTDYANGIFTHWMATNKTGKTINYYTVNISMYNAVGDPALSEMTGSNNVRLKTVGPVLPNDPLVIFSIIDYSPVCSKIVINSINLQYSDGTTETISYKYSGTETLYNSNN